MKGFFVCVLVLGAAFYLIHQSDPANASGGGNHASATGEPIEISQSNYDSQVTHNEAPVLAYFWAPW